MENNTNNHQIDNKFRKVFFRILKISFGVLFSLFVLATLLLYIFKDEIGKELLLSVNKDLSGLLTVEEFTVHPLAQFPNISLGLQKTKLWEKRTGLKNDTTNSVLSIEKIYIAFDIVELIAGNIDLSKVTISGGEVEIKTYADSTINIVNAFAQTHKSIEQEQPLDETIEEALNLEIEKLIIDDTFLIFNNELEERFSSFNIKELNASLSHQSLESKIDLDAILELIEFKSNGKIITQNNSILINTDLRHDKEQERILLKPSWIVFSKTQFNFDGTLDLQNDGFIELNIEGSDRKLNFLSLLLRDEAVNLNARQSEDANLYFEGAIIGKTFSNFPNMEFKFGASNVNIKIPELDQSISELNFDGNFSSKGNILNSAKFTINSFNALLPEGKTSGNLEFQNFNSPSLNLELFLETEISWIDKIFKLESFENLAGKLKFDADIKGKFGREEQNFEFEKAKSTLEFNEISFNVPKTISVRSIDGIIEQTRKNIELKNLSITTEESDLLLNGNFENLTNLLFDNKSELFGNVTVESDKFVFPELFAFDTSAARDFPYTIYDLELSTSATSSTNDFKNFDDFPNIDFSIDYLNGNFSELPDLKIKNSQINIFEDIFGFNIKFDPLEIGVSQGYLVLNGAYNGSSDYPYKVKSDVSMKDLYLLDFLQQFEIDLDTSSIFNGNLNGSFFTEVEFSKDSLMFDSFNFTKGDFTLENLSRKDTIGFKQLGINLENVNYDLDKNSNPLATLNATGILNADDFITTDTKFKHMLADLIITDGEYKIIPSEKSLYYKGGEGIFILSPWKEIPSYQLKYSRAGFPMEDLLATFMEDSLLTGTVDLKIDVLMKGEDWEEIVKELEGEISMVGKDLQLKGVDIDILLERFERSQNFTLLDVSAVLLTGPIGLAVTKGADVAMLVVANSGEVTSIPQLVSNWDIREGILTVDDLAFSTLKNRVAAKGSLDLQEQSADITFAVLNDQGCSRISQTVSGQFTDPEFGDVKVLKTLLGPITNLWNSITGNECEPFYTGSVKHPTSD